MFCRTPNEVHESPKIQQEIFDMYMKRALKLRKAKKQKPNFKRGDLVRVQYKRGKFSRGYDEQVNSQRFIIESVDTASRNYPLYHLKDERGKLIKGGAFLQSQLVGIKLTDKYRGTVLKKFSKAGHKYASMSWKGYSDDWNSDILLK